MANVVFDVDDTSPAIQYFPFRDSLSTPNFTAGWNPLFNQTSLGGAPLQVVNSTTVHVTSLNGSALSVQWQGTGIQLVGYTTKATYSILVDGSPRNANASDTLLASVENLVNANHTISLITNITNASQNQTQSFIVFDKATVSAPPPSNNPSNTFTPQSLNDSDISFRGEWSFQNDSAVGLTAVHLSKTANDKAQAAFLGTAFQIFGTVSPQGGNYSVQLDNVTTQYSAQASLTQNDTLLFYASALDPNALHNVQIINDGGTLILPVGGFTAFSSGNPNPPPPGTPSPVAPNPTATAAAATGGVSLSKGTIAALVLAGILAFILISGFLFFAFVWRPRKRRQREARRAQRKLERAAGDDVVLDIGRNTPLHSNTSPTGSGGSRSQRSNGFTRWKQDISGSGNGGKVLGALGLVFRHSDSPPKSGKAKEPATLADDDSLYGEEARSAKSFSLSSPNSSKGSKGSKGSKSSKGSNGSKGSKGKGKSRWSGKGDNDTPSYTIELPPLSRSKEDFEDHLDAPPPRQSFSGFTSLTYESMPVTGTSRRFSFNAPSEYSQSIDTHAQSAISSIPNHERTDSHGLLLMHQDSESQFDRRSDDSGSEADVVDYVSSVVSTHQEGPQVQVHEVESSYAPSGRSRISRRETDRGSVRTNDDHLSILGPATARAAIRSLSPRTSELANLSSLQVAPIAFTTQPSPSSFPESSSAPRERLLSDETVRPTDQEAFLDVRQSSPFEIDFTKREASRRKTMESASRKSTRMSVRFEDEVEPTPSSPAADKGKTTERKESLRLQARPMGPRSAFRLTPQRPVTSPVSEAPTASSFLDFSASNSTSSSSRRDPSLSSHGQQGLKSRWSGTTDPSFHHPEQQSSDSQTSGASASSPSSAFPFPVSLPASPHHPEGFKPSPPVTPSWAQGSSSAAPSRLHIESHPFGLSPDATSPSDSVPISISDLQFRHSDSETEELNSHSTTNVGSSHLPPHPPLPSVPPTPTFPPPSATSQTTIGAPQNEPLGSVLSSPSYIVNRVFTHSRDNSEMASPETPSTSRHFGSS